MDPNKRDMSKEIKYYWGIDRTTERMFKGTYTKIFLDVDSFEEAKRTFTDDIVSYVEELSSVVYMSEGDDEYVDIDGYYNTNREELVLSEDDEKDGVKRFYYDDVTYELVGNFFECMSFEEYERFINEKINEGDIVDLDDYINQLKDIPSLGDSLNESIKIQIERAISHKKQLRDKAIDGILE